MGLWRGEVEGQWRGESRKDAKVAKKRNFLLGELAADQRQGE